MKSVLLILSVATILQFGDCLDSHSYDWMHHIVLDPDNRYHVKWLFDKSSEIIVFNTCVKTRGWIGFGFSPNGGMIGSDLVIAWVDSLGRAHLQV